MKRNLLLLCLACTLLCSACEANSTAAVDNTTLLETTSETIMTEETTTATEETTTTAAAESETTSAETEETTATSLDRDYITPDIPATPFTISENGCRDYYTRHGDEDIFVEPSAEDAELLNTCIQVLQGNEEFDSFCAWTPDTEATPGNPPFIMDGYLTETNTPKAQLKWVLSVDMNYDETEEQLVVVSIAPRFFGAGEGNDFLLLVHNSDDIILLNQTHDIFFTEIYDFVGQQRCVQITTGNNNESLMSYLYADPMLLEPIENVYGFAGDVETSRIYELQYMYSDDVKCYCLDPVTLQMTEYYVPKEEFMEFYETFH